MIRKLNQNVTEHSSQISLSIKVCSGIFTPVKLRVIMKLKIDKRTDRKSILYYCRWRRSKVECGYKVNKLFAYHHFFNRAFYLLDEKVTLPDGFVYLFFQFFNFIPTTEDHLKFP